VNALDPLSVVTSEAVSGPFLPSLYLNDAQVDSFDLNPHEDKTLQRKTVVQWLVFHGHKTKSEQVDSCGTNFNHLQDKNGHSKYIKMYCKYEFCPVCGMRGSRVHKTRVTRALDRLLWSPVLGYYVFTLPKEIGAMRLPRETLTALEKEAYDIVRRHFKTEGGMTRIHFAGDKPVYLRIHINVLFPISGTNGIGKVDDSVLTAMRAEWTAFVNKYFCLDLKETDAKYRFATTRMRKIGKVKYVLRPIIDAFMFMTLSDEDKEYIVSLNGWMNTRWYGKLSNALYKKYLLSKGIDPMRHTNADPHLSRLCLVCGERFKRIEAVRRIDLPLHRLRWLDDGTAVDFEIFAALKKSDK